MSSERSKPGVGEIDVFGMTDVGRVREENQDHFLLCSLHKTMRIHGTSLPLDAVTLRTDDRLGYFAVVADGLGGHSHGELASRLTIETVARYATQCMDCFYKRRSLVEEQFLRQLHETALKSHEAVMVAAEEKGEIANMATTLTMLLAVWPMLYIVQVGDSRLYLLHRNKLHRLTRDQTLAQELMDRGSITAEQAESSHLANVLSSAIGGRTPQPVTMAVPIHRSDVLLLCTDGLTRHVTDEELRQHMLRRQDAETTVRQLVDLALERGGEDNVTAVLGRTRVHGA